MANTIVDKNYEGSVWQALGFDKELCPWCGNHLYDGICLNACHLSVGAYRLMQQGLNNAMKTIADKNKSNASR